MKGKENVYLDQFAQFVDIMEGMEVWWDYYLWCN
jgi:hypothetical protein